MSFNQTPMMSNQSLKFFELRTLVLPTLFGIEAVTRSELLQLGFAPEQITLQDGLVRLTLSEGDDLSTNIALLNYSLRSCERVLVELASADITNFDQLFDFTASLPWEDVLDPGYFLEVTGYSRKSQLFGVPAMQRLIKKAIISRLMEHSPEKETYTIEGRWSENDDLGTDRLQFAMVDDRLTFALDTSGEGLHKRGYRRLTHSAPIRETLAAAILSLAHFPQNTLSRGELLWDPVCGVGSFIIEAALILSDTAPGLKRHFSAEKMKICGKAIFDRVREQLKQKSLLYYQERDPQKQKRLTELRGLLWGSDISAEYIAQAEKNAHYAGVSELVNFRQGDIIKMSEQKYFPDASLETAERILLVANPPYAERLGTAEEMKRIHRAIADICFYYDGQINLKTPFRVSVITADKYFEKAIVRRADKRRKLYNGMIECTLFQYFKHS